MKPLFHFLLLANLAAFAQKNVNQTQVADPFQQMHEKLMRDKKVVPDNKDAIRFSTVLSPAQHKHAPSGVFVSSLSDTQLNANCNYFKGDSLGGFDFATTSVQIKNDGFNLLSEFQFVMFRKQLDFVKAKYNIPSPKKFESASPYNFTAKAISPDDQTMSSICGNVDLEDGNFTTWTITSGYNTNSNGALTTAGPGFSSTNQNIYSCNDVNLITSAYGNDPIGFPGVDPNGGTYSARVGGFAINTSDGYGFGCSGSHWWNLGFSNGEILAKTVSITPANSLLSFDYAVILNDGGHTNGNQPYFHVFVKDLGGTILSSCTQYYVQAPAGAPPVGFTNSGFVNTFDNSIIYYKNWTSNSINLTPYIGQQVVISFVAAGCTAGAHPGYAYVDAICGAAIISASNNSPCPGTNVILGAPPVAGGTYSWYGTGITGLTTQSVTINTSGTYSVVVTPSQGPACSYTLTKTINYGAIPSVTATPASSLNCTTLSTQIAITSNTSPVTYITTGPGVTGGSTTSLVTVNAGGTYNYTVTNSNSGCSVTGNTVVVQNTSVAGVTAAVSNSLNCNMNSATITINSNSAAVTYTTSGPGITGGATTSVVTVNMGGTYNYTVTNTINNCQTIGSIAVVENTTPVTATATPAASLNCTTLNTNITINTSTTPLTYTSTGPGITGGASSSVVSVNTGGVYNFTVVNTFNQCSTSGSVNVIQNTSTVSVTAAVSNSLNCATNSATISLTSNSAAVTYTTAGPNVTAGSTTSLVSVGSGGTYNYTVTNSFNNCPTSGSIAVVQNTTVPITSAIPASSLNCVTLTTQISISSNTAPVTYTTNGPGVTAGSTTSLVTVNQGGTYNYTVTNSNNQCKSSGTVAVIQNTTSVPPSISNSPTITCSTPTVTINGNPASGVTYTWTTGGGNIVGSANNQNVNVNLAGNYTLAVTNTSNGCVASNATINVPSNFITPTLTAVSQTGALVCGTSSAALAGVAVPAGSTYTWTSNGGGFIGGVNGQTVAVTTATTYILISTHPVSGCTTSLTYTVIPDINSPTVSLSPSSGTITCLTLTVTSTASSNPPNGVSYSWSGPGIVGSSTNAAVVGNAVGIYSLVVTNTVNNCFSNVSFNIVGNNSPIAPNTAVSNSVDCSTTSATINTAPTPTFGGTFTYSWTGPGVNGSTSPSVVVSPTANTVYTVLVTNPSNGCTGTSTVNVTANTTPPLGLNVSPSTSTLTCATPTAVLTASATGASSFTWTAGNGGVIIGVPNSTAGVSGAGTYSVYALGVNGCSTAIQVATVSPNNNAPTYSLSNSSPSITCIGAPQVSVVITSSVPILSYVWTPTTGMTGPTNTNVATFTASGTYTAVITATNGCSTNAIINVGTATVEPQLVAGTGTAQSLSCTNSLVVIAPSFTPSANLTYSWSGPSIIGANNTSSITVNSGGSYSVIVTNTLTGCANTTVVIGVNGAAAVPNLNVTSSSTLGITCAPSTSTITLNAVTSSTNVTYQWSNGSTVQAMTTSFPGIYTVTINDLSSGCSNTATYQVNSSTSAPSLSVTSPGNLPCAGGTATLNSSTIPANVTYTWSGPGIVNGVFSPFPIVNTAGIYTVTVTNPLNGCTGTATVSVLQSSVIANAAADVTVGPAPLTVNFTNLSSGANSYTWNLGDGTTSNSTDAANTYTDPGTYTVVLFATNGQCSDTHTLTVEVKRGLGIIPEIFTPNGDGHNDVFEIKGLDSYPKNKLNVFNRWGNPVYFAEPYNNDWDGSPNQAGKTGSGKLPSGTYYYILDLGDEKTAPFTGFVQLQY
jgi:gliding motility-associated-like protein